MADCYLYALIGEAPPQPLCVGMRGEPLRLVEQGALIAVVGEMAGPPLPEPSALRAHHAVVEWLAGRVDAILPARFGSLVPGEEALISTLTPREEQFKSALELVAGHEQMTLRLFLREVPQALDISVNPNGVREDRTESGPGTRYLAEKHRAHARRSEVPEIAPLRVALGDLVRAERAERHRNPQLLASVYHLVRRGRSEVYRKVVEGAAPDLTVRVALSGPWPPYAFAPESLP